MEDLRLEGDAFEYRGELDAGQPSWDLASVAGPNGALRFALDLACVPDPQEKVFKFTPREGTWRFKLPAWLHKPAEVFRLDANGLHDAELTPEPGAITIRDRVSAAGIYVLAPAPGLRGRLEARHAELCRFEQSLGSDPARQAADLETLQHLLRPGGQTP